ncbi:hypothetical protein PGT21_021786 [Puccinia graminis f. sp. tritici]|uniref:Uncharacterized protein n=1 Tax=Puccinia graminis f. sp. tritici TaxID=56615 RepID=A0A5B0PY49_PUCGR|nr:hypothetical protein PGT21_021786 [Puccinia graminis f. sp. tritici]
MPSIKLLTFFAIIAFGFASADLASDRKTKCTFRCPRLTEGGCLRIKHRDKDGQPNRWEVLKAYHTENHPLFYNCLGTNADLSVCAEMGKIVLPRPPKAQVMTIGLLKTRNGLGKDSEPFDVNHPDAVKCAYKP